MNYILFDFLRPIICIRIFLRYYDSFTVIPQKLFEPFQLIHMIAISFFNKELVFAINMPKYLKIMISIFFLLNIKLLSVYKYNSELELIYINMLKTSFDKNYTPTFNYYK